MAHGHPFGQQGRAGAGFVKGQDTGNYEAKHTDPGKQQPPCASAFKPTKG